MISIGVSVLAAILLISIASTYSRAIQAPMKSVGSDIPRALEGLVFPHCHRVAPGESAPHQFEEKLFAAPQRRAS